MIHSISKQQSYDSTKGVSPVIGSVLIISIMFIVALIAAPVALDFALSNTEPADASISFSDNSDDSVTVTADNMMSSEYLEVTYAGTTQRLNSTESSVTISAQPGHSDSPVTVIGHRETGTNIIESYYFSRSETTTYQFESFSCDTMCTATIQQGTKSAPAISEGVNILFIDPSTGDISQYVTADTHTNTAMTIYSDFDSTGTQTNCGSTCTDDIKNHINTRVSSGGSNEILVFIGGGQPGRDATSSEGIDAELEEFYRSLGARFSGDSNLENSDSWILVTRYKPPENPNSGRISDYQRVFEKHEPRTSQSGITNVSASYVPTTR